MRLPEYIDFIVAPYALHKALQALTNNGVTEIAVTMTDDYLCIRYKNRDYDLRDVQDIAVCGGEADARK